MLNLLKFLLGDGDVLTRTMIVIRTKGGRHEELVNFTYLVEFFFDPE